MAAGLAALTDLRPGTVQYRTMAGSQRRAPRERIVRAARPLFLHRGIDNTSTDALAEAAGVSKRTLYQCYPSKDELLAAVMRDMTVDRLASAPELSLPANATRAALRGVLEDFVRLAIARTMDPEYIDLLRLAIGESGRRPQLAALLRQELTGAKTLRSLLEDARRQKLLRADVNVEVAARMLAGALLTSVLSDGAFSRRPKPPSRAVVDDLIRLFLAAVAS